MSRWRWWLLAGAGLAAMSGFFLAVMRPPGATSSGFGQDLPWQIGRSPDGATIGVFGLTLNESTLRDAVNKLGRRYELGLFQSPAGQLNLEAYFRDALVGGLNARLVLSGRLSDEKLNVLRAAADAGKPTAEGGRRYPVAQADQDLALAATVSAITYLPVVKFDAEVVRKRFGEPAGRIAVKGGTHWLYPDMGLDLLLGDGGEALLQYVPPPEFAWRLQAPLRP
ncbi:MAG: hypothetical protein JNM60_02120 [Candidatus Competibacteraceae bacterium]|nr:hypothetical protein [Candidatus Competibacteraceae bacterium]